MAYCGVSAGVIFLGRPREPNLAYAQDAGEFERAALLALAVGCVILGGFPVNVIAMLEPINTLLIGPTDARAVGDNWLLLVPVTAARSSYSPLIVLVVTVVVVLLTMQIVHRHYHGRIRKAPPWDCGFPSQTPRMQDTAEGFGQPIRQVFEPFFRIRRRLPSPFDAAPKYAVTIDDHFWSWVMKPVMRATAFLARLISVIQQGRISVYLMYSFFTLLTLLFFVR